MLFLAPTERPDLVSASWMLSPGDLNLDKYHRNIDNWRGSQWQWCAMELRHEFLLSHPPQSLWLLIISQDKFHQIPVDFSSPQNSCNK